MKNLVLVLVSVLAVTATASADRKKVDITVERSAAETARLRAELCPPSSPAVACEPRVQDQVAAQPAPEPVDIAAEVRAELDRIAAARRAIAARRAKLRKQPATPAREVETSALDEQVTNLIASVAKLELTVHNHLNVTHAAPAAQTASDPRFKELGDKDAELQRLIEALSRRLDAHQKAIEELQRERYAEAGFTLGGVVLAGGDFDYTGFMIGGRLALPIGNDWSVVGAPSLILADDERPFSAMLQLAMGYTLIENGSWTGTLEAGGMMLAMVLNDQVQWKSLAVNPQVGFIARLPEGFRASGHIHAGPRFDGGNPSMDIGVVIGIGYDFGLAGRSPEAQKLR